VPVTDENGKRFLIWKEDGNSRREPTILWAQPLSEDGTALVGEMRELFRNDSPWEGALIEGPFVVRQDGWFYLFYSGSGCCGAGCNYAMGVARSKKLLGPWQKNPANPILAGNDDWKCPGHGSIVRDEKARFWLLYHAYSAHSFIYTGREGLLDEVLFGANGWPTIHEGKGPSAKLLLAGTTQTPRNVPFIDDFKAATLRPGWQWPQDNKPGYQLGSSLKMAAIQGRTNDFVAAMLARFCVSGNYTVATIVDPQMLKPGTAAGLAAVGDDANALGLAVRDGRLVLWKTDRGMASELAQTDLPKSPKAHLRLKARSGENFQFSASSDGTNWRSIGEELRGKTLPPWDRSVRIALTVGGPARAEAVFDSFRMESD
jgi:xylan 1,4-beta-xylosidase